MDNRLAKVNSAFGRYTNVSGITTIYRKTRSISTKLVCWPLSCMVLSPGHLSSPPPSHLFLWNQTKGHHGRQREKAENRDPSDTTAEQTVTCRRCGKMPILDVSSAIRLISVPAPDVDFLRNLCSREAELWWLLSDKINNKNYVLRFARSRNYSASPCILKVRTFSPLSTL